MATRHDVDTAVYDLVALIRKTEDHKKAYWAILRYGGGMDESFVKANRAGALLFAADLLEAAVESPDKDGHASLDTVEQDGEVGLDYLELVTDNPKPAPEEGFKSKVIGASIVLVLLFLLLCVVIGFKNIVTGQW